MSMVKRMSPPSAARTGVWVGIGAITMSFAAYTSAMVVRHGSIPEWQHFTLPPILYWNSLVLVASSVTLELARRRIGGPFDRLGHSETLLAVTISKDNRWCAPFVDVVNTFYGRSDIPIGMIKAGPTPET